MKTGSLTRKWEFFFIFNLLIFISALYSQSYNVRNYTEDDGLANTSVFDVTQDPSGRMWFATRSGISVYDGSGWETHSNTRELPIAVYSRITCDHRGTIWTLSTYPDLTIAYYREKEERWQAIPKPMPPNYGNLVTSFAVAERNGQTAAALGTRGEGLYLWSGNRWKIIKHFRSRLGKISSTINSIAAYGGTFYIAAANGLYVMKGNKPDDSLNDLVTFPLSEIIGVAVEKKENIRIWILGKNSIGYLEKGAFEITVPTVYIPREDYNVFLQPDYFGGVFYGNRYGIFYSGKSTIPAVKDSYCRLDRDQGLIDGGATNVYLDREKNIWLSTLRGVSKISGMRFANYRQIHGLLRDETSAAREIKPGLMVFGHNDGLTFYDTGDNRFDTILLSRKNYPPDTFSRVLDICGDEAGNIYAAASDMGLAQIYKRKIVRWFGPQEGLTGQVSSALIDKSGRLWVGSYEGIFKLQGSRFIKIKPGKDTIQVCTRRLFPGPGNSIFAASADQGIFLYKDNEWKNFSHPEDKEINSTYSVLVDSRDRMWLGTKAGLCVPENNTIVKYEKQGFRIDRPVYFIIEDRDNRLWFGTDNGVIKWDGKHFKEYSLLQGLVGRETNRAAGFVDHRGRLWIGTDRGLSCYHEEFEKKDIPPPLTELLSLVVSGRHKSPAVVNKLAHDMNNLVFNFRAVSFINESGVLVQTKLEGFDPAWSSENVANNSQERYTNLSPGRYRFHLKARNSEGIWSEVVSSEYIFILKPYWQKWWFWGFILLVSGLLFYSIQRYVSRKRYAFLLEKQVRDKTIALQEAHDELEKRVAQRTEELARSNEELQTEVNERKKIEKALRKSETKYRGLFDNALEGIYQSRPDGRFLSANPALVQMLGYGSEEELIKTVNVKDLFVNPEERVILTRKLEEEGELRNVEFHQKRRDGQQIIVMENARAVRDEQGKVLFFEGVITDISERKQAEEQIKAALKEKEVMLKEIHHRVKNNLQVIISLLNLQSQYIDDSRALAVFKNSRERVRAMALVHEKLYESKDLSRIDIRGYIESLVKQLFISSSLNPEQVRVNIEIEDFAPDINISIPLGLIVNELVANSLKHAFPGKRKGEVQISLRKDKDEPEDNNYTLIVKDNGIGFPGVVDFRDSGTLGMLLVISLVKQLHGVIELDRTGGTRFTIKFKKTGGKG